MRKKNVLFVVGGLFYLCMAFLTLSAKRLHTVSLTKVTIGYPEQRVFSGGQTHRYLPALPQELCGKELYYLSEEEKNRETRYIVRELGRVILGEAENGYCPVLEGLSAVWPLITESTEKLTDGQEVFVENEEDLKSWN